MSFEIWTAFLIAAAVVLVLPGPTIIAVISHSLAHGRKAILPLVIGVVLGDFTAMTLSLLGLGAVLTASVTLFSIVKLLGAIYLIYLGIKLWHAAGDDSEPGFKKNPDSDRSLIINLFIITTLNPRSIAFFIAFLPQFVDHSVPIFPQLLVLGVTFLCLSALNAAFYAGFSGYFCERLQGTRARQWLNRSAGAALIATGIFTAAIRRS